MEINESIYAKHIALTTRLNTLESSFISNSSNENGKANAHSQGNDNERDHFPE